MAASFLAVRDLRWARTGSGGGDYYDPASRSIEIGPDAAANVDTVIVEIFKGVAMEGRPITPADGEACFRAFTEPLYHHLMQHCSFIAHYNRLGFYGHYSQRADDTVRFVRQFDAEGNQLLLHQIVENWQRSDMHPFDLADALARLRDGNRYTQKQIAEETGNSGRGIHIAGMSHTEQRLRFLARNT